MELTPKVILPPVNQVGIVVKDCQKVAKFYTETYGIGPFGIQDTPMKQAVLNGKLAPSLLRIAVARMGAMEIELIQVLEGGEYYADFIRRNGEGIHHVGGYMNDAEDYDKKVTELTDAGIKPVLQYRGRSLKFTYFDTAAIGGTIFELIYLNGRKF